MERDPPLLSDSIYGGKELSLPHLPFHSTLKIAKAPKVKVSAYFVDGGLCRSLLQPCTQFCCDIYGYVEENSLNKLHSALAAYSSQKQIHFPLMLDLFAPFTKRVLQTMQTIPFGKTFSYKTLAEKSGSAKACRAAGNVCRGNPFPLFIPCHRVIASNGSLGGFAYGPDLKIALLSFEGAHLGDSLLGLKKGSSLINVS